MSAAYTPDDLTAWYELWPDDAELPDELVASMLSFQLFVLSRRWRELGQAIRVTFIEPIITTVGRLIR